MKNKNIFRRSVAICISLLICITMFGTVSVNATDTATTIDFADVIVGVSGQEVEVPVVIENNTGIATLRFRVTYDTSVLEFLTVEKGEAFSAGTVASTTNTEQQTITFLWYSLSNVTADGDIVKLRFKILEGYHGTLPLEVAYRASEILDQNQQELDCIVNDGSITTRATFYGSVTASNKPLSNATIKLFKDGVEQCSITTTEGSFKIEYLIPSTYTVQISAPKHCTESFELIMGTQNIQNNYVLTPVGDANGDGKINGRDYMAILQYINSWNVDVNLDSADVNGDGKINGRDYALIMQYINGWAVNFK